MAHRKFQSTFNERQGQNPEPPKFDRIVIIDDNDIDLFINESLLKDVKLAREVVCETNTEHVLNQLKHASRLSDVPDLIFIDLKLENKDGKSFLDEFTGLSDFIRSKCKIVITSGADSGMDRSRVLLNPNVILFLVKPLDAYQLKDIITATI